MTKIRTWYANLPDPVKAGAATFAVAFLGIFIPSLLGWLGDLSSWLADVGSNAPDARPFPDPDVLTKAAFAALSAAFLGLINWGWREAQRRFPWIPGSGPHYADADGGIEIQASVGPAARPVMEQGPFPEPRSRG